MQLDTAGTLHDYAGVYTPFGWRSTEIGTGVRVRDMEKVNDMTWRIYATVEGTTNSVGVYQLYAGAWLNQESVFPTGRQVQRIEVIGGYRDPVRILMSGNSTGRDVNIADGDINVAGRTRR
jgi:hypothetical protein